MIKSINLYIKHQKNYLFFLMVVFVLPLGLFFAYSVYELPKLQYVFLATLFASQYIFYRESDFRRKIESHVEKALKKELGKIPSRKEIYARSNLVVQFRGFSIIISALSIFALMIYFEQF